MATDGMKEGSGRAASEAQGWPQRLHDDSGGGMAPGRSAQGVTLQVELRSDPDEVRSTLQELLGSLRAHGMTPSESANAEIVLAEAMNNIVKHAYLGQQSGWLGLRADLFPDRLLCKVEDGGAPMPDLELPEGSHPGLDVNVSDLPEGGFGWLMIRQLTTDLAYSRSAGLNRLTFTVVREKASGI